MSTLPPRLRTPEGSSSDMRVWLYIGAAALGFSFLSFRDDLAVSAPPEASVSADQASADTRSPPDDAAARVATIVPVGLSASAPSARRVLAR